MRQIILGSTLAGNGTVVSSGSAGNVGFAYRNAGVPTFSTTAANFKDVPFSLVFKRAAADGGDVVLPVHKNKFVWSKSLVKASSAASADADFSNVLITPDYEYTVVFVKKGIQFNERNTWSFSWRAKANSTVADLVAALLAYVANNPELGLTASDSSNVVTFTANSLKNSYAIKFTDELLNVEDTDGDVVSSIDIDTTLVSGGALLVPDVAKYVADLVSKAAADAGFRDTYNEGNIYPGLFGKAGADYSAYATANGCFVYTIRFAEPRVVRTVEDVVNQVVQIVLPGSVNVTALDTLLASFGAQIA